ncbi:hypothetical protein ACP70R_042813 [Stipagrostis hirtigluma subsp. patula]
MDMDMESHLTAGYCAATGTYHSRHPPLAAVTAASFPGYLFRRLLTFPPDRPAFIDASTGAALSFADLRALSLKAAGALAALGLRRGHVVLLLLHNSLHFPVLSLGVLSLGAVLSTANPLLTPDELADQARDSEPFLVLAAADLAPKLRSLTSRVVVIDQLLSDINDRDACACADPGIGRDDPALLFYSSGTTGRSKGVVTTHGNAIAMAASLEGVRGRDDDDDDGVDVDVYGCVLPLFHMFGFSAFVLGSWHPGHGRHGGHGPGEVLGGQAHGRGGGIRGHEAAGGAAHGCADGGGGRRAVAVVDDVRTAAAPEGGAVFRRAAAARAHGALPQLLPSAATD